MAMSDMDRYESLDGFSATASDDPAKADLELVCERCLAVLCDVEPGDTLGTLARVAANHDLICRL